MVNHQEIIDSYKKYGVKLNEKMVKKAIEFAIKYHGDQTRASGEAYYHHPVEVARIIASMKLDSDSIVTAILHDTVEDTELTLSDIEREFSPSIARLVDGVTKLAKIKFKTDNIRQAENFRKLLIAMSDDIRVLLVKLADRLHNMRTINFISKPEKKKRIALETMEIYAPLAERIGMQQIKVELQDICFSILNPEVRDSIVNRFEHIESDKENYIDKIITGIKYTVSQSITNISVSGRKKTPYSTWMKMKQKGVGIDQLSDIIAFRIIVEKKEDCYRTLGIIHSEYKVVPGNFQDFISTPKNNGYQSLHTVVIGPLMQKIEVQIRTKEMHDIAELGVAAHWRYKQGHDDPTDGMKYTWLRELLFILEQNVAPDDMLQNTKMAMYYDQVFCFTPQGNLIALPKGATIIDFAYVVDSKIGNTCIGAKVNGRSAPLSTELFNGDQVEIITEEQISVQPEWEKFVVTGKARSEIRKIIHSQQNTQYSKLGFNILNEAFNNENINDIDEALKIASTQLKLDQDNLLCSVGKGELSREEVLKSVLPKKSKLISTLKLFNFRKGKKNKEKNYVPIKGLISGMALHYAKCCHPLPGDKITGIIHTGKGVTIHTNDCDKLNDHKNAPEKMINLTWDINTKNIPFICRLNMTLNNEPSTLAMVSTEIARDEGNIINFKILNRNAEYFEMNFDVEVKSSDHIETIIHSLRTKKAVYNVHRAKG